MKDEKNDDQEVIQPENLIGNVSEGIVQSEIEQTAWIEPVDDHEHIVDIESEESQAKIAESRAIFAEFLKDFGTKLDLEDKDSVAEVLKAAKTRGIYDGATRIREYFYGRNVTIYGVSYLSNVCEEKCLFCPMGQSCLRDERAKDKLRDPNITPTEKTENEAVIATHESRLKTMTPEEAEQDMAALAAMGHNEICVLAGSALGLSYENLIPYVRIALSQPGIREVSLNLKQFEAGELRAFLEELQDGFQIPEGVKLQFRIFQETYDPDVYDHLMQHSDLVHGKRNYSVRYNAQIVAGEVGKALEATGLTGITEIGIGALFGLRRFPIEEIADLQQHAEVIKLLTGIEVKRCCLPFGNEPKDSHVEIPFMIPGRSDADEIIELIYALARLAMPTVSIVSSERDGTKLLRRLDRYAPHTTWNVHPYPCGNIEALEKLQGKNIEHDNKTPQADTQPRKIEVFRDWLNRDFFPRFDIKRLRRTIRK